MSYRVQTLSFSGPFDLLLRLVSRQRVDIGAISVCEVADQYLAEVEQLDELDLDVASDFILVASTLLDIKAASLVPDADARAQTSGDDDEFDVDEGREVLIARLVAYTQHRRAAAELGKRTHTRAQPVPTHSSSKRCPITSMLRRPKSLPGSVLSLTDVALSCSSRPST